MFSISPFSTTPFSTSEITSIKPSSVLHVVATLVAEGFVTSDRSASLEAAAILEADGTLILGGVEADLNAVATFLSNATVRGRGGKIFAWTISSKPSTWTITKKSSPTWTIAKKS